MEFKKENYLNLAEIEELITTPFPNTKANIIAQKLKLYCVIADKKLYVLQENDTYKVIDELFEKVVTMTSILLELSFKSLSKTDQRLIQSEHAKTYKNIFSNADIKKYYEQLKVSLQNDDVTFDVTMNEIHFENGYYDLKDGVFKKREINKHFVSNYVKRNYKGSTKEERKLMLDLIRKIYPTKKDLDCIIFVLGSALSGTATKDQEIIFLLGQGNSGKSTTLKITNLSIQCYLKELQSDTFSQGNTKIDKILNSYGNSPQVRLSWVNEMEGKKINDTLFKKFCEGELQTTKLYQENQHDIKHYSKCIITSNEMPNFRVDSGMSRRIKAFTHEAKFVKTKAEVNEQENIFLEDADLISKINNEVMLNAWFDILAKKCKSYLAGDVNVFTDNFKETKSNVMSGNDYFQDFIDSNLTITNEDKHRIGKEKMRTLFLKKYPDKHVTVLQVMTSLRDKGIVYNSKYRCDNVQGCYVGVQVKCDDNDEEYENGVDKKDQSIDINIFLKTENEELKKQIEQLKKQLEKIETPPKEVIKVEKPKKQLKEESDIDDDKPKKAKKVTTPTAQFADIANEMLDLI
jgi:hypothetical protein